jgi:hypothetical protein
MKIVLSILFRMALAFFNIFTVTNHIIQRQRKNRNIISFRLKFLVIFFEIFFFVFSSLTFWKRILLSCGMLMRSHQIKTKSNFVSFPFRHFEFQKNIIMWLVQHFKAGHVSGNSEKIKKDFTEFSNAVIIIKMFCTSKYFFSLFLFFSFC